MAEWTQAYEGFDFREALGRILVNLCVFLSSISSDTLWRRMEHQTPLIAAIVGGLVLAFIFGAIANRFRLSPLVGYLLAGVVVGPFTPGFVADQALTLQLAEIGVILLMFGVGLHFSLKDLLSVKAIAIPGALTQIAVATLLGMALGWALGWPIGMGLVFGPTATNSEVIRGSFQVVVGLTQTNTHQFFWTAKRQQIVAASATPYADGNLTLSLYSGLPLLNPHAGRDKEDQLPGAG